MNLTIQSLQRHLKQRYPRVYVSVSENRTHIWINNLRIPDEFQGKGLGTAVVNDILVHSDTVGKPIRLHFSPDRERRNDLRRFYTRLGFKKLTKGSIETYEYDPIAVQEAVLNNIDEIEGRPHYED
jgi:GNAT superfamily N-acetyltransferase